MTGKAVREIQREHGMRYVTKMPRRQKPGWTLAHNHVRHTANMLPGRNGFRAWWFTKSVSKGFKPCGCGWSGLPHVSAYPDYKSERESVIARYD